MRVGLIGYGKMGRGIFSLLSEAPLETTVYVRDPAKAEDNNRRQEKRLRRVASGGALSDAELSRRLAGQRFTSHWEDLRDCQLLIETVTEDFELKIDLLRRLEDLVSPAAVITSNTSSFSPTQLAHRLARPERFAGFHFFHPIQLTSVIEIIVAEQTSPSVVELLEKTSRDMQRTPLVIKDRAGSCINVILTSLSCEMFYILEQGLALPSKIDAITGTIARLGPCEAVDVTGLPFLGDVITRTIEAFPFGLTMPQLCQKLIRDGRHGKYAGKGIFLYRDDRPIDDVPAYYVNPQQTHSPPASSGTEADLLERLIMQINHTALYLAELGLGSLSDLCLGFQDLMGLKFDARIAMQQIGAKELKARLARLQGEFGQRFDPAPLEGVLGSLGAPA